jgi:hypothetical protein
MDSTSASSPAATAAHRPHTRMQTHTHTHAGTAARAAEPIRLTRAPVMRWLTAMAAGVVLAHVLALLLLTVARGGPLPSYFVDDLPGAVRLLHLDGERNVPAQFSALLLLLNAGLFAVWGRLKVVRTRAFWLLCAAVFALLACDELFELHERIGTALRGALHLTGLLYYAWVLPYAAATLLLTALAVPALFRLPPATRRRLALAAAVYLGGALGMEMLGGFVLSSLGAGRGSLLYLACVTLEESLEIAGLVLLTNALLRGGAPAQELALTIGPATAT